MIAETVKWVGDVDGVLEMIDQRRLPTEYVMLKVRSVEQLHEAIRTLAVRGAPAIGVSAAYGPVLALQWLEKLRNVQEALDHAVKACDYLATSRPTAVNLFWALDRMRAKAREVAAEPGATPRRLAEALLAEANAICAEDVQMCRRIGENGEKFIRDDFGVLTHCNAGALATAGQGTALSVMFEAQKKGRRFEVYADETRPLLQGSRLTAWELQRAGIKVTVICDNMAGFLMKRRRPHRRQRRHRQQDRHLQRQRAGQTPRHPVLHRGPLQHVRPEPLQRRADPHRAERCLGSNLDRRHACGPGRGRRLQPCLRRDSGAEHHRDHHGKGSHRET